MIDLQNLVAKLNDQCQRALEDAAGVAMEKGHFNVEPEHWLLRLVQVDDGDVQVALTYYRISLAQVFHACSLTIGQFKVGNTGLPGLSPEVISLMREGWIHASINREASSVRSGDILIAFLALENASYRVKAAMSELRKLDASVLAKEFGIATERSCET